MIVDEPMHEQDRRRGRVHAVMEESTLFGTGAAEIVTAMPIGDMSRRWQLRADSTTRAGVVARGLRDAGMEVIYTGLHQTPEQIVATPAEDANALGLSVLSGAT